MYGKLIKDVPFSRQWMLSWFSIILGSLILSSAFVLFINPYHIIPGGVYGLGIVLHYLFPQFQVGTYGLCLDIPLLLLSFRVFGPRVGAKTIVAAIVTPLFMNLLTSIFGEDPTTIMGGHINLSDDILLSSIFGGLLMGAGLGIIFKNHATSGGTDIIAMIITKFARFPISKSIIYVESVVVVIGLLVFGDWKLPLYSIVTIFVSVKVIDYFINGMTNDKLIFIISEKHEDIRSYVINDLERGGTYIKASGMYTLSEKHMMFVVVSLREVVLVQDFIKEVDPLVFMVVINAHETLGDGFKSFQDRIAI